MTQVVAALPVIPSGSLPEEPPADYAARLGALFFRSQTDARRRELGQFFTPAEVARFMAHLARPGRRVRTLLDPGAGSGILACALLEELGPASGPVHLDAYEVDPVLARVCETSLTHAQAWLSKRGVALTFQVQQCDFVTANAVFLSKTLFDLAPERLYDVALLNPPYFKLQKHDERALAAAEIVHGQPNIYAIFMAITARLLKDRGVMVSITPRSFTTGDYFRVFRQYLFSKVTPEAVHLFESRNDAFQKDEVLQENVILRARKARKPGSAAEMVRVSTSLGTADLTRTKARRVPMESVLDAKSKDLVFHIPTNGAAEALLRFVRGWSDTLATLGLAVSTGPVVAFRARSFLLKEPRPGVAAVPLLWLNHVKRMKIEWPLPTQKPQLIRDEAASQKLLLPSQTYVVMRRFSAKEESRRLVAAPLFSGELSPRAIGLENHLNYIYRTHGEISREEAVGLSAVLSSSLLDRYFRISNGNTQVNATELRALPMPSGRFIKAIGAELMRKNGGRVDVDGIDGVVAHILKAPAELRAEKIEREALVHG